MINLNIATKPNFTRPRILLHPLIPPALYGINPRTIKGTEWWDVVRREVYAKNNHCCFACGVFQLDTRERSLDAHEMYTYDYDRFEARMIEIVALCRECHQFIHWLGLVGGYKRTKVIVRGLTTLHAAGLPLPREQVHYLKCTREWQKHDWLKEGKYDLALKQPIKATLSNKWELVLDGKRYPIVKER